MKLFISIALAFWLPFSLQCQNNYSLVFDGNSNIQVAETSYNLDNISTSFTFSANIYLSEVPVNAHARIIHRSEGVGGVSDRYMLSVTPNDAKLELHIEGINSVISNNSISLNTWTNVAGVYDGAQIRVYINGHLEGANSASGIIEVDEYPFWIGSAINNSFFNGKIDNVGVWDIALTEEEIQLNIECPPNGLEEEGIVGFWGFEEGVGNTVYDLTGNGNDGTINGAIWSTETNNNQCLESLCEQIEITFLSVNTDIIPNTIEFEIDVQYDDDYGFGYGGFVLSNNDGDIIAQETLETAGNVYWIGQGINETRVLIANEEMSFPFSGSLYLIEGFFSGNGNAECVYSFNPGCMNSNAINYDTEATIDDGSCQFDNACNVDAIEVEAFMYGYEPSNLVIEVGDQVTWTNIGGYHDVNGVNNSINAEPFNNPESFSLPANSGSPDSEGCIGSYTFTVPGTYYYDCSIYGHASLGMTGTITVIEPCNYSIIDSISTHDACIGDTVTVYGNNLCVPMNVHLQGWTLPNELIIESNQNYVSFVVPEVSFSPEIIQLRYINEFGESYYTNILPFTINETQVGYDCFGNCIQDLDEDGICDTCEDYVNIIVDCECEFFDPSTYTVFFIDVDEDNCIITEDCYCECLNDTDGDGVCDENEISGCTDESACNFNPYATEDDYSCVFIGSPCDDGDLNTLDDEIQEDCECAGTPASTVKELESLSVLIYPNPTSNNLTVDLGDLNGLKTMIKLYDSSRKLVFEKLSSSILMIDVSGFAKGMYSLELSTDEKVLRCQVIFD